MTRTAKLEAKGANEDGKGQGTITMVGGKEEKRPTIFVW